MSCEEVPIKRRKRAAVPKESSATQVVPSKVASRPLCQTTLQKVPGVLELKEESGILRIQVDESIASDEFQVRLNIADLMKTQLPNTDCPFREFEFEFSLSDGLESFRLKVALSDFDLYLKQLITRPELIRRMSWKTDVEVPDLVKNLVLLRRESRPDDVRHLIDQIKKHVVFSPWLTEIEANLALESGEFIKARELYQKVLVESSASPFLVYNLSYTLKELGLFEEALLQFESLFKEIEQAPFFSLSKTDLVLLKAEILLKAQKVDQALELFKRFALEEPEALLLQGIAYRFAQNFDRAETLWKPLETQAGFQELIYENQLALALEQRDESKALAYFEKLKSLGSNQAQKVAFLFEDQKKTVASFQKREKLSPVQEPAWEAADVAEEPRSNPPSVSSTDPSNLPYNPKAVESWLFKKSDKNVPASQKVKKSQKTKRTPSVKRDFPYLPPRYPRLKIAPDPKIP